MSLQPGTFEYLERELHAIDDSNKKGDAFEKLCKKFLQTAPIYRDKFTKVWLGKEYPSNWGIDKGIDLFAETTDGKVWAIQAKAYGKDKTISKRKIDSFLSDSARPEISHRLLIATTDNIGRNAQETIASKEKGISTCLRGDFLAAEVDWPETLSEPINRLAPKTPANHAVRHVGEH